MILEKDSFINIFLSAHMGVIVLETYIWLSKPTLIFEAFSSWWLGTENGPCPQRRIEPANEGMRAATQSDNVRSKNRLSKTDIYTTCSLNTWCKYKHICVMKKLFKLPENREEQFFEYYGTNKTRLSINLDRFFCISE